MSSRPGAGLLGSAWSDPSIVASAGAATSAAFASSSVQSFRVSWVAAPDMSFSRIDTRVGEYFLSIASPRAPCKQGQLRRKKLPQCVLCVVVGNGRPRRLKSGSRPRALLASSFRRRTSIQPLALTTSQLSGKGAGASQPSGGGTRVRDALRSALFARESRQPKEQGRTPQRAATAQRRHPRQRRRGTAQRQSNPAARRRAWASFISTTVR